jgi:hypothetical protein
MKALALKKPAQRIESQALLETRATLTLEQRFTYTVSNRAQGLLKANHDRLNTEQTQYAQDNNPKSNR